MIRCRRGVWGQRDAIVLPVLLLLLACGSGWDAEQAAETREPEAVFTPITSEEETKRLHALG